MNPHQFSRRQFLTASAALVGTALFTPSLLAAAGAKKLTATDQVALGKTGLKLSRLGFGTGTNGGKVQRDLGREGLARLIRYAYDQGVTYIDTAQNYQTHR
jgi:hypothetical protein